MLIVVKVPAPLTSINSTVTEIVVLVSRTVYRLPLPQSLVSGDGVNSANLLAVGQQPELRQSLVFITGHMHSNRRL